MEFPTSSEYYLQFLLFKTFRQIFLTFAFLAYLVEAENVYYIISMNALIFKKGLESTCCRCTNKICVVRGNLTESLQISSSTYYSADKEAVNEQSK